MSAHLHVDTVLNHLSAKNPLPSFPVDGRTRAGSGTKPTTAGCADVLELSGQQHLRLADGVGCTVTVLSGELWITQDGDVRDIVLAGGEELILDRDSPALLSSLGKLTTTRFLICRRKGNAQSGPEGRRRAGSLKFQPSFA
jgi:hypothetical protein